MLSGVEIEFEYTKDLSYNCGSSLHGYLMEIIDEEAATILHRNELKPYSQYIYFDKGLKKILWRVFSCTKEGHEKIIKTLIENKKDSIYLRNKNRSFRIISKKEIPITSYNSLIDCNFISVDKAEKLIKINFLTPTSFKSNNEYQLFPSVLHIYKSLFNKWNTFSERFSLDYEEAFNYLVNNTKLYSYNLRTTYFYIDKVKIPSFIGSVVYNFRGLDTMLEMANVLFSFAEYSGVGVKTSLGMGGVSIECGKIG